MDTKRCLVVILAGAVCVAACSSVTQPPPPQAPKVASRAEAPVKKTPEKSSPPQALAHEEQQAPAASKSRQPEATEKAKAPTAPKSATTPPPSKAPAAAAPSAAAKPPPAVAEPAAAKPPPAAQPAAPKAAPLDLKSLEQRLKETNAIGVMTKLSLKNQVDDLLDRFRAYHDGKRPPTLSELRPGFELLLMKVLSLLQDKDAALAQQINASRDAIWNVLADKQKFAQFS